MSRKMTGTMLLCIILLVLSAADCSALGITPAKKTAQFVPGTSEYSVKILNNENKDLKLRIKAGGELSEFVEIDDDLIIIYMGEAERELRFKLNLPEKLKPGTRIAEIAAEELVEDADGQTAIKAASEVIHTLHVQVPYPGKYAEAKLYVSDVNINETAVFTVPIMNFGSQKIEAVSAEIQIYDKNKKIATLYSTPISIDSQKEGRIEVPWKADVENAGVYHAIILLDYDGEQIRLEKDFYIGNMLIEVVNIMVERFNLGSVAKFDIYLENRWNEEIKDVYGEMIINDKNGNELTRYKTSPADILALGSQRIISYWDTSGLGIGKYDVKMILHYAGKATEKMFEIQVNIDSITTPYTPTAAVLSSGADIKTNSILVLLILFLIILNVILLLYLRKNNKNNYVY